MSLIRFNYDNKLDGAILATTSEHPNFPVSRIQHMWPKKEWRSRYGTGSGWGYFGVGTTNQKIDFEETGATPLVATILQGQYTADSLCTAIKTALELAGASTYTVTYSDSTNKFTIVSNGAGGGGIFTLLWFTGANKANSAAGMLGFLDAADDSGALTYTSDNMRIHTIEVITADLGSAIEIKGFGIKGHNFQNDAVLKLQANTTNSFVSPSFSVTIPITTDLIMGYFSSAQTYRYWRIYIEDIDNPDGYVKIGRPFLGSYFSPVIEARRDYNEEYEDNSKKLFSEGGQISVNEEEGRWKGRYVWDFCDDNLGDDLDDFKTMWEYSKAWKDMFVTLDVNSISTRTFFARIASKLDINHILDEEIWRVSLELEELL